MCPHSGGTLHRQGYSHLPPTSELEAALEPATSHLEGVGNYLAARAATTFIHYTPPPFIALIVPCNLGDVKTFVKIDPSQAC